MKRIALIGALVAAALTPLAAQAAPDAPGAYDFTEYDATGAVASKGRIVQSADGALSLRFSEGVLDQLSERELKGEWNVFGGRYCYEIEINGRINGECGVVSGDAVTWASGGRTVFMPAS